MEQESPAYGYTGWQSEEDEDVQDARPGVYWITIFGPDGEEDAVIIHRTVGGQFPLDGDLAKSKMERAAKIVAALNATL